MKKRLIKGTAVLLAAAMLVTTGCSKKDLIQNLNKQPATDNLTDTQEVEELTPAEMPSQSTDNELNAVYKDFAGEYKQTKDASVSGGYLTLDETQEVRIRFAGAKEWTKTSSIKVTDQGNLQVECEYYHSEAEPDDIIVFTLEKKEDNMIMKIISSEFPLLQTGDEIQFSKY